jgi:hypothetical protein
MEQEPRIYVYKMTTDNGGAPCVLDGLLSLAICKPEIRRMAKGKSIIFGFGAKKPEYDERLIYIAVVEEKLSKDEYYIDSRYTNRPDCIYQNKNGVAKRKGAAVFHPKPNALDHDVGKNFQKGHVLLSRDFRYFGKMKTDYKQRYPKLEEFVRAMGRPYRVNDLPDELMSLKEEMWQKYPKRKKLGNPTASDRCQVCYH